MAEEGALRMMTGVSMGFIVWGWPTSEAEDGEVVILELWRELCSQAVGGRRPANDGQLVRIDQRPGRSVGRVLLSVEQPHPGHNLDVVSPTVAQLMPPVLTDNLVLADLVS